MGSKEEGARHFSGVFADSVRDTGHKLNKIPSEHKKTLFSCESGQTLAQVAEGGCGVTISGDTQNLTGRGPWQPALKR